MIRIAEVMRSLNWENRDSRRIATEDGFGAEGDFAESRFREDGVADS